MDGGPFWLVARLWAEHNGDTECVEHDDGRCVWFGIAEDNTE